jgi:hypothetical protein
MPRRGAFLQFRVEGETGARSPYRPTRSAHMVDLFPTYMGKNAAAAKSRITIDFQNRPL